MSDRFLENRVDLGAGRSECGCVMEIKLLYFAHVKQIVGKDTERLSLAEPAVVQDVIDVLLVRYPTLEKLFPAIRVAVNGRFVELSDAISADSEVVLIPPVSGGSGLTPVMLTREALNQERLDRLVQWLRKDSHGSVVTFVGVVRDHADGRVTKRLHYEAYESMALTQMQAIVSDVEGRYENLSIAAHHGLGTLEVGEWAVIVAVASGHRAEGFEACQEVMARVKADVPIWKQEEGPDGNRWV